MKSRLGSIWKKRAVRFLPIITGVKQEKLILLQKMESIWCFVR